MIKRNLIPTSALEEKLGALTPPQRLLLILAIFLVLGAGFYFYKYKPQAQRISGLKASIVKQEKRLAELKDAAAQVEVFKEQLAKSEEELDALLALLPDKREIPGLLESVSQLGAEVGLENILFQPQPEQLNEFYAAIPVRLDLLGSYHELGIFFDKISKLDRILKVDNVNMSRHKDASLQVGCTIMTYRFIENAGANDKSVKHNKKGRK